MSYRICSIGIHSIESRIEGIDGFENWVLGDAMAINRKTTWVRI